MNKDDLNDLYFNQLLADHSDVDSKIYLLPGGLIYIDPEAVIRQILL